MRESSEYAMDDHEERPNQGDASNPGGVYSEARERGQEGMWGQLLGK
jgi:hypothetical protein